MPRLNSCYLGLDPGEKGGIAIVDDEGLCRFTKKMPPDARSLWELMSMLKEAKFPIVATLIERIDPRPTRYFSKQTNTWISTILRSSCIIYGDFLQLHMAALAAGFNPQSIGPHEWQKGLGIDKKVKGEKTGQFKNRLKAVAQQRFPNIKITLATADALLIAEYCRLRKELP